jgi:cytochrome P450
METLLQLEAQELGNFFAANIGKPISLKSRFNASVINSLWYICTGSRFDLEDPDFLFLITTIIDNFQKAEATGVVFFFPWVLKKDFLIKGFWKKYLETRDKTQGLIKTSIAEHEKTYTPGSENRDLIDAFIEHRRKTENPESSFYGPEGEMNQLIVLLDLFVAGSETSSSILQWAMLYMIMWPEVQAKVQEEIDSVIGKGRAPTLEDKANLIYTEAVLCEVHRHCTLVPFSVYHSTLADTKFAGYKIPKDTCIFANIRDAHHDKEYWGDPENFRPERFIEKDGKKIIKHEAFMPFSTGKRICLGESLAKDTFFLFFTHILQRFRLEKVPGVTLSLESNAKTFVVAPKPYEIVIHNRA